jgi:hypothetical protein
VKVFFSVNAWIVATFVAALSIDESVREFVVQNITWFLVGFVVFQLALVSSIWIYARNQFTPDSPIVSSDPSWHVESLEIRFCNPQDSLGTESVYHEWFTDDVAIDDDEYDKIVARGGFVRVIEADLKKGGSEQRIIVGYYSVFPIKIETFDLLRTGKKKEQDLLCSDVLDPSDPNAKVLYIPEICESKGRNVGPALVRDLIRYVSHTMHNNKNISYIAAWPYTKYGKKLINDFGMKPAVGRRFFQKVYCMSRVSAETNRLPSGGFKDRRRISF